MGLAADSDLLEKYAALDSPVVSDALELLGLPSGFGGLVPLWGHPTVVGYAVTVQLAPAGGDHSPGSHIATGAVDAASPTDILVVANAGRLDVSCWGGLLSQGASLRGIRAVVADGACRDLGEARELRFPVFARGCTPRTARGRLRQVSQGEPVDIGGVLVFRGDVVLADDCGVVIVPIGRAEDVLGIAQRLVERERSIAEELRAGTSMRVAMHDSRLAGDEWDGDARG